MSQKTNVDYSAKKTETYPIQVRVPIHVLARIDNLAGACNLDRAEFVKMWLGAIAKLKRENAIRAIGAIPQEMFYGSPGRPSSTDTKDDEDDEYAQSYGPKK